MHASCLQCMKRCCLNCWNHGGSMEFIPGRLVAITCHAQPGVKHISHITGDMTEEECKFHEYHEKMVIIAGPAPGHAKQRKLF